MSGKRFQTVHCLGNGSVANRCSIRTVRRPARHRRGAVLVEMAISFLVLSVMVFGVIEMGFLFRDKGMLSNAARVAARSAANGDATTTAIQKATASAAGLSPTIKLYTVTLDSSGNVATSTALTDESTTPATNAAGSGTMIEAIASYKHYYLAGIMGQSYVPLQSVVVMQRE